MPKKGWVVVKLPNHGEPGCTLVVNQHNLTIEPAIGKLFPSSPRQYLIINHTDKPSHRGEHIHLTIDGKLANIELMFCIQGSAIADMHTANGCEQVILDSPTKAIIILPDIAWHDIILDPVDENGLPTILVVIASTDYDVDAESEKKPCNCTSKT